MAKKNQTQQNSYKIVIIASVFVIVFGFILFNNNKNQTNETADKKEELPYGSTIYVTPTILKSVDTNHSIFIHPQKHFSFQYPNNWEIILTSRNFNEPWYDVVLTDKNNGEEFNIYFETGGRDYPSYREEKINKTLGNKQIIWTTLYNKDNEAVEAFTSFPNNDFGDNLLGLYIYLPKENQNEFIAQVEELIASLK